VLGVLSFEQDVILSAKAVVKFGKAEKGVYRYAYNPRAAH
jgi:hypothetical protein